MNQYYPYNYNYQNYHQPKNSLTLVFVNTLDEANKYIVAPNQTVLIKIGDGNSILEKTADFNGNYFVKLYERKDNQQSNDYATKNDLNLLLAKINDLYNKLGGSNE